MGSGRYDSYDHYLTTKDSSNIIIDDIWSNISYTMHSVSRKAVKAELQ